MNDWIGWLILAVASSGLVDADALKSSHKVADEGFGSRVNSWFRADSGKPLKRAAKQPPLGPGRGIDTRAYS